MYTTSVLNEGSANRIVTPSNTRIDLGAWVLAWMGSNIVSVQVNKYCGVTGNVSRVYRVINWNMQGSDPVATKVLLTEEQAKRQLVSQRWADGDFVLDSDQSYCDGFWIGQY